MNINDYYKRLNSETSRIFEESLKKDSKVQGGCHDLINNLQVWFGILKDKDPSSHMLLNSMEELDISCLQMLQGIYRGSFSSLRLSLEMLMGSVFFSTRNIEYIEWSKGTKDLIWAQLTCPENGIFSKRFSDAYFSELSIYINTYMERTKKLYRELSEMVHGNNRTWNYENPSLLYNSSLIEAYHEYINVFSEISNFVLCLRYLNVLSDEEKLNLESHIIDSLGNVREIRIKIGGPKDE